MSHEPNKNDQDINAKTDLNDSIDKNSPADNSINTLNRDEIKKDTFLNVVADLSNGHGLAYSIKKHGLKATEFFKELAINPNLKAEYDLSRLIKADLMADELLTIADDDTLDVGRAYNMIQARKWVASKYNPKNYSERLEVNVNKKVDISVALDDAKKRLESIEASYSKQDTDIIPVTYNEIAEK